MVYCEGQADPTRPVATLEHVGGAQFHGLLGKVPQHTVGADYPEEVAVPTQAMVALGCRCPSVQCPGPGFLQEGGAAEK